MESARLDVVRTSRNHRTVSIVRRIVAPEIQKGGLGGSTVDPEGVTGTRDFMTIEETHLSILVDLEGETEDLTTCTRKSRTRKSPR